MIMERLRKIYEKYGYKAIYPPLYLFFFLLNFLGSLGMAYPATDPNELSIIAVADFFAGNSWSGVMCSVDYYYDFLQGLIYTPIMFFFSDPGLQYSAMIFLNSLLVSFIPVFAFSLARRMGVGRVWKMLLVAFVAGGYCCYFAHSKFAWSETITILLPWFIIWLLFKSGDCKGKASKCIVSVVVGLVCGLSLGAHSRMIAVILALILTLAFQRFFFRKKLLNFGGFIPAFVISTAFVGFITSYLQNNLWCQSDPSLLKNTFAEFFANFGERFTDDGLNKIIKTLCGQLYYFVTSSWGMGALAICLFFAILSACIKHKKKDEPQTYSSEIAVFGVYSVLSIAFTVIFGTLYRFSSEGFNTYQDTTMFGRFLDGVIPFASVLVLIVLFTYSIKLNKVLGAIAVLGIIFTAFSLTTMPTILQCGATRISPVLALYPLRIGAESVELLTFDSMLLTMSMTFCVMGILVVIVSCSKRRRSAIISVMMTVLTVYSLVFIFAVYLPICRNESVAKNSSVVGISESVYNQTGAPTVTAYNLSRHNALMLRFLNRNINVRVTYDIETVPENSFLAVNRNEDVSALENSRTVFLLVAESGDLRLYAYGERAVAYMQSQDVGEEEIKEEETLIPEKTTVSETKKPETVTSTPPETTTTTAVSTPHILTSTENSVLHEDELAILE